MTTFLATARRVRLLLVSFALVLAGSAGILALVATPAAQAATPATLPSTVSADPLPTVQQNGVVWAEVTVGNTVYATGSFSQTWPAGTSNTAANDTARANLLAFNLTTGNLITSFNHTLNAQGLTITASPDGSVVYVGGDFTTVDGLTRNHIAAFSTATGALLTTFAPSISGEVEAISATSSTVYVGGNFSSAKGVARTKLAAFTASTGALLSWAPTADNGQVQALVVTPDQTEVIVGGRFPTLNGVNAYGLGAVDAVTGATLPYAANQYIRDYTTIGSTNGNGAGINSLTTDGNQVYGSGFSFNEGNFEGTFGLNPDTGAINFVDDCHGDTYDVQPVGQVLYSVSHAHDCSAIGDFPDTSPRIWHHALAETTYPTGTNTGPDTYGWNYNGLPDSTLLPWYPTLALGTVTGQSQAAWSVTGNSSYLALGGEFPSANGVAQAGLVRYAIRSIAPNKVGPETSKTLTPSAISLSSGTVRVAWQATWDQDDPTLTYNVLRDGSSTPVYTTTQSSSFWQLPAMGFTDTGLTPGSTHTYRVQVVDPWGNKIGSSTTSVTVSSSPPSAYVGDVLSDGASNLWRFNEASGSTAYDWAGFSDMTEGAGVTDGAAGPLGDSATAATFNGTSSGTASTSSAIPGPNTFSIEAWFKTTSSSGGKIVGFGNATAGNLSGSYDRHIYMTNSGQLVFGVYNNGTYTITSSKSYNDGSWHQVVGELSSSGMMLYVDGKPVGQNTGTTIGQPYSGYWSVGGDNLNGWPSQPSSNYFNGAIGDVAIYPTPLSIQQVQKHYTDSGRTLTVAPAPTDSYGAAVYKDNPELYWRLDDTSGPTALDTSPYQDNGTYSGGVSYQTPSPVTGPNGTGVTLNGSSGIITSSQTFNNPTVYSEELWFKTSTTSGGRLIGFGSSPTGSSSNYDRMVWMLNSGQLEFGAYNGNLNTITSPNAYNDGAWHYLVATQGPDGMTLYVDGKSVGTNPDTQSQSYTGYWRIGGDNTWGGNSSNYFAGSIDEAAVYATELTASQVQTHYLASPAAVTPPPVASFTRTCQGLSCSFDASGSTDQLGTITSYAWNFGDGSTGSGQTVTHTFTAGEYPVLLTVTDSFGNTNQLSIETNVQPAPSDNYGQAVMNANPALYWRLDDSSGPNAADTSINDNTGVYSSGVGYQAPSTVTGPNGTGVTLNGQATVVASQPTVNPTVYSEQLWFNTTTTSGGRLIGFGDQPSGNSNNYDRMVWMLDSGQLEFGTWTGQPNTITSSNSYNDGKWHELVATQGPDGMTLYVDGQVVGTNPDAAAQAYTGYWRLGADNTWGGNDSAGFTGSVDEAAVYNSELSATQVLSQYNASFAAHTPPTASFTANCSGLTCALDASGSTDPDGTITSYAWSMSDGGTASGVKPSYTFNSGGMYSITLTTTDNFGATSTSTQSVTVAPPQAPTASFTFNCTGLTCTFDASGSTDPSGTISGYAWTFPNGDTASGKTTTYTFPSSGAQSVKLTVSDSGTGLSNSVTNTVTVTGPSAPVASFTSNCTYLTCTFDASGSTDPSGTISGYSWTFPNGDTASGKTTTYTFAGAGAQSVTLVVSDSGTGLSNSVTNTANPTAPPSPPTAAFTSNCTALVCSFDASSSTDTSGTITGYSWSFGDGTNASGQTASDTYQAAGDYTVTLTVTDSNSQTAQVSHVVSPRPAANPSIPLYASDSFNRTVTGGWGTADTGGAWSPSGSAANLSVANGVGSLKMASPGSGPGAYLSGVSTTDSSTFVTVTTNAATTDGGIYLDVIGRRLGTNLDYRGRVNLLANGSVSIGAWAVNGSTQTAVGKAYTLPGVTYTPGMQFNVELQVTGTSPTTVNLRVWPTTATQPTNWQVSGTNSLAALQTAGSVGVVSYLSSAATTSPVSMQVSSFASGPTAGLPNGAFTSNCSGQACSVNGTASTDPSGTISSYQWSWGDGVVTTGATSTHTYATAGTYRITLTVTDPSGWTSVVTKNVTVPA